MIVNQEHMVGIKKIAKFIWRHFFTLADLSLSINVLISSALFWKNALISLSIAITIDWAKQFIKLTPNPNMHHSIHHGPVSINRYSSSDWSNPYQMGSEAYYMRQNGER